MRLPPKNDTIKMMLDGILKNVPESDRTTAGELRTIEAVYDQAHETLTKAISAGELTPAGLVAEARKVLRKAKVDLKPYEDRLTKLAAKHAEGRAAAIAGEALPRTPETIALEREVRDRLMAITDPVERNRLFLQAIERRDRTFVSAVDNAPAMFPLIDAETAQTGRELRLLASPEAESLGEMYVEQHRLALTMAYVKAALDGIAIEGGFTLASVDDVPAVEQTLAVH